MTENCKLRRAILSAFYNISQRNFGILLILWCSFKLWWNFCLDQNFSYKVKGPLFTTSCWKQCFRNMVVLLRNGERLLHECISSLSIECKSHRINSILTLSIKWDISLLWKRFYSNNTKCIQKNTNLSAIIYIFTYFSCVS
jgi:hypothetical protein